MLAVTLLTGTLIALVGARIYERCELARDLQRLGVPREQVATWVCIAFHESRYDTAARNPNSGDHGLLQISELYWCGPGKACGLPCSALRDDNIADDVRCALSIYKEHTRLQGDGFMAWVVYPHYCRSNPKKYLVDCDRSVKSFSDKFDENPRRAKTDFLNFTIPQFVDTSYDNRPLPNYLRINSLLKENNFEEFERDYYNSNKRPFNWINFKIDNIDDLVLPMTNRKGRVEFATVPTATTLTTTRRTTTARSTTTLEPELRGIKPPSPRRIESNQFRRRKMKLEEATPKSDTPSEPTSTTLRTTPVLTTTMTPEMIHNMERDDNINYYSSFSVSTPTTSTTTTTPISNKQTNAFRDISSTRDYNYIVPHTTTVKPTTGTSLRTTSDINSERNYNSIKQRSTTMKSEIYSFVTRKQGGPSRGFRFYSAPTVSTTTPSQVITRYVPKIQARDIDSTTKKSDYNSSDLTFIQMNSVNQTLNTSEIFNFNKNISSINETSPNPSSITIINGTHYDANNKTMNKVDDILKTKLNEISPSTAGPTVMVNVTSQPFATRNSSRGKSRYSQPTTQRPIFSSPSSFTATSQTTKLSTETWKANSRQSIFDLYLNPTKRPTFQPFSFTPFKASPHRLRIFSGGTTPTPSS